MYVSFREICPGQVGIGEIRILQVNAGEISAGQIRVVHCREPQNGVLEILPAEVPAREVVASKTHVFQVLGLVVDRGVELLLSETAGVCEPCSRHNRPSQVGVGQVRRRQIGVS